VQDLQKLRLKQITARQQARADDRPAVTDPAERMRQRAIRLSENGAALKMLADAMDPLYRSLDDAQKRRFAILSRMGPPRGLGGQQWRGRDGKDRSRGVPGGDPAQGGKRTDAPVELMPFIDPAIDGPGIQVPIGRGTGAPDGI
jgi:hypothetical protein